MIVSRRALDVEGMGDKIIEQLVDKEYEEPGRSVPGRPPGILTGLDRIAEIGAESG